MLRKNKIKKKNIKLVVASGFSLIEVLFSLIILSVGIVSTVSIMTMNIKTSITARNQIIAAQLVQEGIELSRNLSDNKYFTAGSEYSNYRIERSGLGVNFSPGGGRLYINGGFYSHIAGNSTKFSRKIDISDSGANQRFIRSTVSWDDSGNFPTLSACTVSNKCASVVSTISY